ncbi:hypothetical protein TARUN_3706 [Trichoderma arundinaceum]|uniref:Uncharacterized protein n=1 Tax=Trichoderma arundinaceum TaxID=490622 RepID=A0A395NR07_TRIAR|nr:hypothetical protein TARUN_3706 [Trichoderma arundinaceum]
MLHLLFHRVRRPITFVVIAFVLSTVLLVTITPHRRTKFLKQPWNTNRIAQPPGNQASISHTNDKKIHILLPATRSNVNLCKTLLTMTILGYPNPTIIAWEDEDKASGLLGGGSHFAKITRTLDYINDPQRRNQTGFDDELVMMLDAYDIWFQLPIDVLLSRYNTILEEESARVAHRMGRAYDIEGIHPKVIFGAGKRCAPNLLNSVSCYPVPESPLPNDVYGGNTDTLIGINQWSSFRTRYLNSGYTIGPVGEMRRILERAMKKLEECQNRKGASFDDGTGASDFCYHGSDQSIFVEMFGEQEYYREIMRRHHRTGVDDVLDKVIPGRAGSTPPPTNVQNAPVVDRLEPDFTHQQYNKTHIPEKPFEFGMALDYWSLLGHQTSNAITDARYIRHNRTLKEQIGKRGIFDCTPKTDLLPLPHDLPNNQALPWLNGSLPNQWEAMPLYTEICIGTVPVMIHHNSVEKFHRERQWDQTWWHGRARMLLEERRKGGAVQLADGIPTDKGTVVKWEELCPKTEEKELFRDVDEKEGSA